MMRPLLTEGERKQLILKYIDDLVPEIASEFRGGTIEYEDLLQEGCKGLVKAAAAYRPGAGAFATFAASMIRGEIQNAIRAQKNDSSWLPKEDAEPRICFDGGDRIERVHDWQAWGTYGNVMAIVEAWSRLMDTPGELAESFESIRDKSEMFAAAFMSLTQAQRKIVRWVFLVDVPMDITQAARELKVSRFRAGRMLKAALKTMRDVIIRIEQNKRITKGRRLIPPPKQVVFSSPNSRTQSR